MVFFLYFFNLFPKSVVYALEIEAYLSQSK